MSAIHRFRVCLLAGCMGGLGIGALSTLAGVGVQGTAIAWASWYYWICLGICSAFVVGFKDVRGQATWAAAFVVAIALIAFGGVGIYHVGALIGDGMKPIGFTYSAHWYFIVCVCLGGYAELVIGIGTARNHVLWILAFAIAGGLQMALGIQKFADVPDAHIVAERLQHDLEASAGVVARVFMWIAPGALAVAYGLIAFLATKARVVRKLTVA